MKTIFKKKYIALVFLFLILIASILYFAIGTSKPAKDGSMTSTSQSSLNPSVSAGQAKMEKPGFTRETYPKVDGSTATIPLSEAIASEILGMSKDEAGSFIKHNTTHLAYMNLIQCKADIIFVTEPSVEEIKAAKDANIELEVVPIVKEGFVFIVNTKNPVKSVTTKQLQDIYQGKIKNWKDVGGADKEIVPYQREANSGSQTLMEQLVMKGLKLMDAPKNVVMDMSGLIDRVANYDNAENALGYSVYYYAKTMYNKDTIKLLGVDGVLPDNKSISSGKYPFTSSYYAVIKKSDAADAPSRKLLKWILSIDGQNLAEKSGYVPLEVR
ncbi:MAG: substrate-binding domain-containing protein [Bacillota bacterium]|nr:substrate-binding domain-containing protein [Bacillota bacterium]